MKTHTDRSRLLAAAMTLAAWAALAAGQSSATYRITADVLALGSGSAHVSNTAYRASVTIGQHSIVGGPASSTTYRVESGFQATLLVTDSGSGGDSYDAWAAGIDWNGMDSSPGADPDDDGFTNEQEHIADTDPTQSDSYFHLATVAREGATATIAFHSSAGRVYELWFTADLTDPDGWIKLLGPRAGIGGTDSMIHEQQNPEPSGFYRVRVALP